MALLSLIVSILLLVEHRFIREFPHVAHHSHTGLNEGAWPTLLPQGLIFYGRILTRFRPGGGGTCRKYADMRGRPPAFLCVHTAMVRTPANDRSSTFWSFSNLIDDPCH